MAELDKRIVELEARVAKYETELDAAITVEEKQRISGLINTRTETLNRLLDEKKAQSGGGKLKDGIPELHKQNLTLSPPSVSSEKEHASCNRIEMKLPFFPSVPEEVLNASNTIWRKAHTRPDGHGKFLYYSSEDDIAYFVRIFLEDILLAMNLPLDFNAEVTIKQIRPDLCVLLMGMYLVGVVEVKKPGKNVLLEPTVLGELMDQMLLVEGFYGMGPVIGILTTAEEWLVSWFPVDSDALAHVDPSEASFTTPIKQKSSSTSTETKGHSPPGGTPSQQRGTIHSIDEMVDVSPQLEDGVTDEMERLLCATRIMNIYEDPICVLQHLCSAFQLMAKAHSQHTANLSRCLLKFHKGLPTVTFHPVSYDSVHSKLDFNKFPSKNVKTLVALEDLGRGSTGKAWLCVTVTQPRSALCVLKFDNKHSQSENLVKERDMWHLLYPELSSMVKLEHWSGADALVMPHFSTVLESERAQYKDEILQVLTTHFMGKGKVHRDVRWCNIGKYRSRSGAVALVVYDLHDVVDYDVEVHHNWIDKAMQSLFVVAFEEKNALILVDNNGNNKLNIDNYMVYARRLNSVIRIARYISYQLACLSTLGGANHLCDKPKTALKIAMRQEFIGLAIGSTSIVIRSRVYQAVNYGLMKKANRSKKIFTECEEDALVQGWSSLIDFVKASKIWLQNELEYKKLKSN